MKLLVRKHANNGVVAIFYFSVKKYKSERLPPEDCVNPSDSPTTLSSNQHVTAAAKADKRNGIADSVEYDEIPEIALHQHPAVKTAQHTNITLTLIKFSISTNITS